MSASYALWVTFATLVVAVLFARSTIRNWKKLPSPPGPPGDPIIGHIRFIPPEYPWLYYTKLHKQYGDIMSFSILGAPIVVLNTFKAASELLGKRSTYNDRPTLPMTTELMGLGEGIVFASGTRWKDQRRMFQSYLTKTAIQKYWAILERNGRGFPLRVLDGRESPLDGVRVTAAKNICQVAYGIDVDSLDDLIVRSTIEGNDIIIGSTIPGRFVVNLLPSLMHIPEWFPGAGWKRQGKEWSIMINEMYHRPYDQVKDAQASGNALPSFALDLIQGETTMDDHTKMHASGAMYVAGTATLTAMTKFFLLAMTMYPEVQKKAQDEIERVVGSDRLPGIEDKPHLPYVEALMKELFRWASVAPGSIAHCATEDDVYEGFRIAKGAIVVANTWAMGRDELMYPHASEFIPERFLLSSADSKEPPMDPRSYIFGVGRRMCPGYHFAELAVFMTVVSTLATVNIRKALNAQGREITVEGKRTGRNVSYPVDFECRLEPRSADAVALARDATS